MANQDAPFGFRPVRHLSGGQIRTNEYKIAANYGTSLFQGQALIAVNDGTVAAGTTSGVVVGIFGGCFFTHPTTGKPTFSNHYPASTNASDIVAFVYDDPQLVFEVQGDGIGVVADIFSGFDLVGTSGSTLTGRSTQELDTSTTGTSGQFKMIGISKDPNNSDVTVNNTNVYVVSNTAEHTHKLTTAI